MYNPLYIPIYNRLYIGIYRGVYVYSGICYGYAVYVIFLTMCGSWYVTELQRIIAK